MLAGPDLAMGSGRRGDQLWGPSPERGEGAEPRPRVQGRRLHGCAVGGGPGCLALGLSAGTSGTQEPQQQPGGRARAGHALWVCSPLGRTGLPGQRTPCLSERPKCFRVGSCVQRPPFPWGGRGVPARAGSTDTGKTSDIKSPPPRRASQPFQMTPSFAASFPPGSEAVSAPPSSPSSRVSLRSQRTRGLVGQDGSRVLAGDGRTGSTPPGPFPLSHGCSQQTLPSA